MAEAVKILQQKVKEFGSQRLAGDAIGASKSTVNLLLKGTYPNPERWHKKILDKWGDKVELIGVSAGPADMEELSKLIGEIG